MGLTMASRSGAGSDEAVLRAETARSAMARLLAVAGHDLKQPLQVALMAIDRAVWLAVRPRTDRTVDLYSIDFGEDDTFDLRTREASSGGRGTLSGP